MIWGVIPLQFNVSSKDTAGRLFVFEHADMGKGGPPRRCHYEQDEWFYAMKGECAFEVGPRTARANSKVNCGAAEGLFESEESF